MSDVCPLGDANVTLMLGGFYIYLCMTAALEGGLEKSKLRKGGCMNLTV